MGQERDIRQQVRSALGYYDWTDVAQCACQIARKFGISGGRGLLTSIKDLLQLLNSLSEKLSYVKGVMDRLQGLVNVVLGLDPVKQALLRELVKIRTCPMFDNLMWSVIREFDFGSKLAFADFLNEKLDVINNYGSRTQEVLQQALEFLVMLSEMLVVMEECVGKVVSDARTLAKDYFALEAVDKPKLEKYEEWLRLQIQRGIGTVADGVGKYWFVYEEGGMVKLLIYENGSWSGPVDLIRGLYPKIWFDGTYVYLMYVRNDKLARIRLLPQELGYLGLGFTLWDCIGMSGFVNSVGNGKFRGCVGEFGNVDRIVWNYKGEVVLVSYPDSFVGGISVPTGLYWSDSYNRLNWSDVVVQSPWSRRFRIYEEGNLFAETDQVSYYDEGFSRGMNYWVTTVLRNTITGEEWEGCPSDKMSFTVPKIGAKEYIGMSVNVSDVGFVSYGYNVNSVFDTYSGINGSVAEESRLISYFANVTLGGEDVYDGVNGTVEEDVKFINFFPNELM